MAQVSPWRQPQSNPFGWPAVVTGGKDGVTTEDQRVVDLSKMPHRLWCRPGSCVVRRNAAMHFNGFLIGLAEGPQQAQHAAVTKDDEAGVTVTESSGTVHDEIPHRFQARTVIA